jgi:hypothetical protein
MSGSSDTEPDDDWICAKCHHRPINGLKLEYDLLPGDKVFLIDSNGEVWLFCRGCRLRYHLKCVENLPKCVTKEDSGIDYYCEDCGMFLVGAYDSE